MERKIKFTGKPVDGGDWVYGYYAYVLGFHYIMKKYEKPAEPEWTPFDAEWVEVIPESVGQFTTRKDKNGVEIYESNVIVFAKIKWLVKWVRAGFELVNLESAPITNMQSLSMRSEDGLEVIGNKTDNPELLNG